MIVYFRGLEKVYSLAKATNHYFPQNYIQSKFYLFIGAKWFAQRKLLTSAFHFKILERFIEIFGNSTKQLLDELQEKANAEKPFNVGPIVGCATLDILLQTSMGVPVKAVTDEPEEFVNISQEYF